GRMTAVHDGDGRVGMREERVGERHSAGTGAYDEVVGFELRGHRVDHTTVSTWSAKWSFVLKPARFAGACGMRRQLLAAPHRASRIPKSAWPERSGRARIGRGSRHL